LAQAILAHDHCLDVANAVAPAALTVVKAGGQ